MGLSIAIPTFNRSRELGLTLESMCRVIVDTRSDIELLIIDNNSTDNTREVSESHSERFAGRLRYVRETRQGLNHARNRAVSEARYEIVAFLDDDVEVHANWCEALLSAHGSGDYAAVGGRAYLIYPRARPNWLGVRDEGLLTKVELGPERRLAGPDELYGLNVSFKRNWVERVGWFRGDLDRIGKCLLSSGETELLERVSSAGGVLLYEPSAVVGHRVPPERLRRRWFWARIYWGYRGEIRRVPERQVSLYELTRRTWHVVLAGWDLARGLMSRNPWGEECFHRSLILAGRLGAWFGLAGRLTSRRRSGNAARDDGGPVRVETCPVPSHPAETLSY